MKDQKMTMDGNKSMYHLEMEWKILHADSLPEILFDGIPFQHQVLNVRRMIEEEAQR